MPSCSETEALPRTGGGSAVTLISGIYAAAQQCGMGGLASLEVHQIVLGLSGTGPQTVFGARQPQLGQVGEIDRQSGVERLLLGKKMFWRFARGSCQTSAGAMLRGSRNTLTSRTHPSFKKSKKYRRHKSGTVVHKRCGVVRVIVASK